MIKNLSRDKKINPAGICRKDKKMAFKKSKYTRNQQKAFNSGRGYAVAHKGKRINFKSAELKESFVAGYRVGVKSVKNSPNKYSNLK